MYYTVILSYKNLILQLLLCFPLSLLLYFLSLPTLILRGLNTYIHPDDVNPNKSQSGPKVAIRRPSDNSNQGLNGFQSLSSNTTSEIRNRKKSKEKFEFDEANAQIFRLRLNDAHLASRIYYDSYRSCFNTFFVAGCCFLLQSYLDIEECSGILKKGSVVPILVASLGVFRALLSLLRVSLDRSAFKRIDRQLGLIVGISGFFIVLVICSGIYPSIFDFEFEGIDGYGGLFVSVLSGSIAGFLYLAAAKSAKALWLGTDQIRCNLLITSCDWFSRLVLYGTYLIMAFTSLLWITPFAEILVKKDLGNDRGKLLTGVVGHEKLVGNVGMARSDLVELRFRCLLLVSVLQIIALRTNLQTYLNEAVLSWYQRLHASKVPELEYSRAKVFLHNHYLCLALVQFFTPAALVVLFIGLSQVDGGLFENFNMVCGMLPCLAFVKEVAFFMAWWITFLWTIFTSVNLALYRRGILYIS